MSSFLEFAEGRLEKHLEDLFYPEIPDYEDSTAESQTDLSKRTGPEPHISTDLRIKLLDPLDEITRRDLEKLSIEEYYQILEYFQDQKGRVRAIIESIRGQVSLVKNIIRAIEGMKKGDKPIEGKLHEVMKYEKAFLTDMEEAGLRVKYQSDLSIEELDEKANLIMINHQGGGGENYIHQALTGIPGRLVVKGSLMKIPYIREGLEERQAIPVSRNELKEPERRKKEIEKITKEVAAELGRGGNVYVFIEGTRSRDGAIAATSKRKQWASDFLAALEQQTDRIKFQKLLLVVNTMTAMPDAPEEKGFGTRFRTSNTTLSGCLMQADHLRTLDDEEEPYSQTTLFGTARTTLKEMLIDAILENQPKR